MSLGNGLIGTGTGSAQDDKIDGVDHLRPLPQHGAEQPWGNTIGTNTVAGTGDGTQTNYTVYGRVPAQTTPSAGFYSDTVVATVTY